MARKRSKMGDGEQGFVPGIRGRSRGTPGITEEYNTPIENDVWSKDWASPLNAYTPKDPMVNPRFGGIFQPEKLGLPGNPLGIGGIDAEGKYGKEKAPNDSAKEIFPEGGEY